MFLAEATKLSLSSEITINVFAFAFTFDKTSTAAFVDGASKLNSSITMTSLDCAFNVKADLNAKAFSCLV